MSELLKKQNYGVEVEFTGITRAMAAKAVAEVIHSCFSNVCTLSLIVMLAIHSQTLYGVKNCPFQWFPSSRLMYSFPRKS